MRREESRLKAVTSGLALAVASGGLVGLAFPPNHQPVFIWVALVPLFLAIRRAGTLRSSAGFAWLAGTIFSLFVSAPLVSSHEWTGWAALSRQELAAMRSFQWWFLRGMWVLVASWAGGGMWALFAVALKKMWQDRPWRLIWMAPTLWVAQEWFRVQILWRSHWAVFGNATADFPAVRQAAALGGPWLLSLLIVAVNCAVFLLLFGARPRRRNILPAAACGLALVLCWAGGTLRLRDAEKQPEPGLRAGVLQHHKPRFRFEDFTVTGLGRAYVDLMETIFERMGSQLDVLVLPESVSLGSVSLDGTLESGVPEELQADVRSWEALIGSLIGANPTVVVLGSGTSEGGRSHNSLLFFNRDGLQGVYHKRDLVPFAERSFWFATALGIAVESPYSPGVDSGVVSVGGLVLGGFICQEVLFPDTIRESVRSGAQILVSGGNDGVFASPAVASIHADLAQLRAVETGRYVVRAMSTGISAIIDPTGREIQRSGSEPVFLWAAVEPRSEMTPFVRFGDWVVWVSLAALLTYAAVAVRDHRRANRPTSD
jgi:apolipoprotein N-acyltransferase